MNTQTQSTDINKPDEKSTKKLKCQENESITTESVLIHELWLRNTDLCNVQEDTARVRLIKSFNSNCEVHC